MKNKLKLISENGQFSGSKLYLNDQEIPFTNIKIEAGLDKGYFIVDLQFLIKDKIEIELKNPKLKNEH